MKKIVILFVLLLLLTGCGNKSKDLTKTSFAPGSKPNPSTTTVTSAMPSIEPTIYIDNDTESKIKQLLPEGTVEVSILKSVYVYPSAEDEKREKELEKKYREGLDKNWNKILGNFSGEEKDMLEHLYNKNVDFRDTALSFFNTIKPSDVGFTNDEFNEFTRLYNLADKKNVEDKKAKLNIRFDKNKLSIISNPKSKYIDKVDIDFGNSSLSIGDKVFKEAKKSDKFDNDFSVAETQLNLKKFNIDDEYYETLFIWQNCNFNDQFYFSIYKLQGSESIVLRYSEFIFESNKYSEDLILIKK